MATIKSYTDIPQSKRLSEILPLESADMFYIAGKGEPIFIGNKMVAYGEDDYDALGEPDVLCWSLAALLEQLDDNIADDDGNDWQLEINKEDGQYYLNYHDRWGNEDDIETDYYDNPLDACYEMILKLHELKIL